jgi:hypothetical protein
MRIMLTILSISDDCGFVVVVGWLCRAGVDTESSTADLFASRCVGRSDNVLKGSAAIFSVDAGCQQSKIEIQELGGDRGLGRYECGAYWR